MELLSLPTSTRLKLQPRLQSYKADYEKLKRDLNRAALLGSAGNTSNKAQLDSQTQDQQTRLMQQTNRLNKTSDRLDATHRIALETGNC